MLVSLSILGNCRLSSKTVSFVIIFSLFGSEFQKYALSSLQQLLADHPPAPEGLDPDTGTAPSILT